MTGLGPDARALLDAAGGGDDPSPEDQARVRAKLARRIAVAAGATAAGATSVKSGAAAGATKAAAGTAASTLSAKAAITMAIVGVASAGSAAVYENVKAESAPAAVVAASQSARRPTARQPAPEPLDEEASHVRTPSPTIAPSATPSPTIAPSATPATPARSAPTTPSAPRPRAPASAPPSALAATQADAPTDTVVEEARLLRAAQGALAAGDARTAKANLDEHATRFPNGALAEERRAARVLALCADGNTAEGRAAAAAFVAKSPRSPLAPQVRRACATGE